jgi:alkylhydroperoxidase family enzyme
MALGDVLAKDPLLDPRHREILVLRVAWRTRSDYQWGQHTRMGQQAGLTTDELFAIPEGAGADVWGPLERDLLHAVDEMIDQHGIGADTWSRLAEHFDTGQLIELAFVVGSYLCLAVVFNSVGLRSDPPTEPITAPPLPPREP